MKKDKLLQHQLKRLDALLTLPKAAGMSWGKLSTWGWRVVEIRHQAILRSLKRFYATL